ncbi:ABC transporter permease [Massilia sp. METH4]|uniref:ABC transporter permease n=1 Tax=Massilia sp. METH4 TaxID=3123041 RepID=UPI0030D12BB3
MGATTTARVLATSASYQDVNQRYPRLGRFISEPDDARARRVAVIDEDLLAELHLPANPLGKFLFHGGEWFKIVGVLEKQGAVFGMSQDNQLIILFNTGRSILGNHRRPNLSITVAVNDMATWSVLRRNWQP